jgi:hypothetical protein
MHYGGQPASPYRRDDALDLALQLRRQRNVEGLPCIAHMPYSGCAIWEGAAKSHEVGSYLNTIGA